MNSSAKLSEAQYLSTLIKITEEHLSDESFGVPQLAKIMGISRSGLHRKIKKLTGKSANPFIRELRLKKSLDLLSGTNATVSEIAYDVGFGSVAYFDRCFHKYYGISPGEARLINQEKDEIYEVNNLKTSFNKSSLKNIKLKEWIKRKPARYILAISLFVAGMVVLILIGSGIEFLNNFLNRKTREVDSNGSQKDQYDFNEIDPGLHRIEAMRLFTQADELFGIRYIKPRQSIEYAQQAQVLLEKAIDLDSTYYDALKLLAEVFLIKGKTDSALIYANKALRYGPNNPNTFILLGSVYAREKDAQNKEKNLVTAL